MLPIFRVTYPSDIIQLIEQQNFIWTRQGRVLQVTVNAHPTDKDAFVALAIQNEPYIYKTSSRYSYILSEFQNIDFSLEVPGIMYYTVIEDLGDYWNYASLDDVTRSGYNNLGLSLYDNNYTIQWATAFNSIPVGPQVQGFTCMPGNAQNTLTWTPIPGASSYTIYYNTVPGVTNSMKSVTNIVGSSYTHTGLVNGTHYYYRIAIGTPIPGTGQHPLSAEVGGTPMAPATSAGVLSIATAGGTNSLTWTPPSPTFLATGFFNVYVSSTAFNLTTDVGVSLLATNITALLYNDTPATPGTYYYRISAVNAGGMSPLSNSVNGTV